MKKNLNKKWEISGIELLDSKKKFVINIILYNYNNIFTLF